MFLIGYLFLDVARERVHCRFITYYPCVYTSPTPLYTPMASLCQLRPKFESAGSRGVASLDCPGGGQSWWASRWRVSANCALARTGGCLRGNVPPSEAGRFWNFDTEFTQFSDNFYAKFIPLEMFKYLWNIMFFLSPFSSLFPFLLFSSLFLSFPFSLFLPLFLFPFLFSFSLFFLPFSLFSSFPSFSFLSPFFPFPIFALLPDFWCPGGQSAPLPPPPPHWLRPWLAASFASKCFKNI